MTYTLIIICFMSRALCAMEIVDEWQNEQLQEQELSVETMLSQIKNLKSELKQIETKYSDPEFGRFANKIVSDNQFFTALSDLSVSIKMATPYYSNEYLEKLQELQSVLANLDGVLENRGSEDQIKKTNKKIRKNNKLAAKISSSHSKNEIVSSFIDIVCQMRRDLGIVDMRMK